MKILVEINGFHIICNLRILRLVNIFLCHCNIRASVAGYARVLAVIRMEQICLREHEAGADRMWHCTRFHVALAGAHRCREV
jgi:hypothetical protein